MNKDQTTSLDPAAADARCGIWEPDAAVESTRWREGAVNRSGTKPLRSRAKRRIPKSSKGHFVGELVFNRSSARQRLGFESLNEHNAALCLIYRPDVVDVEEQLAALPFVLPNGRASQHTFVSGDFCRRTPHVHLS